MLCFLYAFGMSVICFRFPRLFVTMFSSSFLSDDDDDGTLFLAIWCLPGAGGEESQISSLSGLCIKQERMSPK